MKKLLMSFLLLTSSPAIAAQSVPFFGLDSSGSTRNVYVLDPTNGQFVSMGSFATGTDVWNIAPSAIPAPTALTLGGVFSSSASTHNFATGINTSGAVIYAQPACGDLSNGAASCSTDTTNASNISSGTLGSARLPLPTVSTIGGVEAINSLANNWVAYIDTSGVPHQSQPAFSNLSGQIAGGQIANSTITNAMLANSTISGVSLGSNLNSLTFGTHLAAGGSSYNGSAGVTITSDATNANTALTIVARDGSGNFSAGTITASLTGHSSLDLALTGGTLSGNLAISPASGFSILTMEAVNTQQAAITFQNGATSKWQVGKQTDDTFFVYDTANNATPVSVSTSGNLTLGETTSTTINLTGLVSAQDTISANPSSYWQFIMSESWAGGTGFGTPFVIQDTMTNGGTGNRQSLTINTTTGYAVSGTGTGNIVGLQLNTVLCGAANVVAPCTGQGGGGSGHAFGLSTYVSMKTGSGTDTEITGYESDVDARTATNLARKTGVQVISTSNDAAHAATAALDAAYLTDASGVGFERGVQIGSGSQVLDSTNGVAFAVGSMTMNIGLDLSAATYNTSPIKAVLPASAGAGGKYVCVDNTGVFYEKASCP